MRKPKLAPRRYEEIIYDDPVKTIEEAPYLSMYEAALYAKLDRFSLRQLMAHYGIPEDRVPRGQLDHALDRCSGLIKVWRATRSARGDSLGALLSRGYVR